MIQGLNERLRKQREFQKYSQKDVADIIGTSASVISNYESGERTPSIEILIKLAGLYQCSTDYLLGIKKSNSTSIDVSMLDNKQLHLLQSFLSTLKKQG